MTTLTMIEVNCETGETTERPLTAEEIAQRETDAAEYATRRAQIEAEEKTKADAKVSALAKLAALGLTEDEAKAIAG